MSKPAPASFRRDLSFGQRMEKLVCKALGGTMSCVRAFDFSIPWRDGSQAKVELKAVKKTYSSLFLETLSDTESGAIGGPFRAARDGVPLFLFLQPDGVLWFFRTDPLVRYLAANKHCYREVPVSNREDGREWITLGLLVPFADLWPFVVRLEVIDLDSGGIKELETL